MKQAPSWNKVCETFKGNADVVFGDVALSENQVRTIHGVDQGAGAGGWPTVRHFNKETGYGGKAYEQKTGDAMCDELGPKTTYMQEFVEQFASLCDVNDTATGCTDKQKEFIGKWSGKPADEIKKQLTRLEGMSGGAMKPEAMQWLKQRLNIFQQLSKKGASQEL